MDHILVIFIPLIFSTIAACCCSENVCLAEYILLGSFIMLVLNLKRKKRGAWMVQSVKRQTLVLAHNHDFRVVKSNPMLDSMPSVERA